jgi:hypothetical protein
LGRPTPYPELQIVQNQITKGRSSRGRGKRSGARRNARQDPVGQYATDAWSLAKRTAYGLNEIRKLINIETKFHDAVNVHTASTAGDVYCISELAQGLTSTDRVGDSIKLQHIEIRGKVTCGSAATTSIIRFIAFRDLDGYGTAPTAAQVLELTGSVSTPLSPYKFNNNTRFSILFDETFTLQYGSDLKAQGTSSTSFYFAEAHGGHVKYLTGAAAPAADGKGSIYILIASDEATNVPLVSAYSRILYTDD